METLEIIALIVGMFASLAAVFLAALAFRTYRDLTPLAQEQRRREEHMEHLASHVMQMLDRISTIWESFGRGEPVALFHFPALCHGAKLLDKMLTKGSRLGLVEICLGDPHRVKEKADRWRMNTAFRSALLELAITPSDSLEVLDPEALDYLESSDLAGAKLALVRIQYDFFKLHFFLGVIRLGDACVAYRKESSKSGKGISIGNDLDNVIGNLAEACGAGWTPNDEDEWDGERFREHCSNYILLP